jgi:hypothetical protein
MFMCSDAVFAQNSSNTIPTGVTTAFTAKYPNATVKRWHADKTGFIAKAWEGSQKFYATFDQNGHWVNTTSKITWSWNLPAEVRASLKSGKFAAWGIDGIKKVETPAKNFYQVCVDNGGLQPDADHAEVFTETRVLDFTPDGEAFAEEKIRSPLVF